MAVKQPQLKSKFKVQLVCVPLMVGSSRWFSLRVSCTKQHINLHKVSASLHVCRSSGTASSDMQALQSLTQAQMFLKAHLLLLLVFAGTTPFAASLISLHVTDEKRSWVGFWRLKWSRFLLVVSFISQLVARTSLFTPFISQWWVSHEKLISSSKPGLVHGGRFFTCWRITGKTTGQRESPSNALVRLAWFKLLH